MDFGVRKYIYAIPIVSFCDIPLSEIDNHTSKYGPFALGLTKEWAQENKLNTVVYIDKDSNLSAGMLNVLDFIFKDWHEYLEDSVFNEFYNTAYKGAISIIHSSKNYKGKIIRNGNDLDMIFYDEREWRYIPQINNDYITEYPDIYWEEDFAELNTKFSSKPHFKEYGLKIKSTDIKHIIIPDRTILSELLYKLRDIQGLCENTDDYNYLITNIITLEKIKEDF